MCAHVLVDEQFRLFSVIASNPFVFGENFSETVRQNPECKAWNQACDQGVVLP